MHRGLIISVLFHTLVILAFAIGLPFVSKPQAQRLAEIPVEIANIASITNPPKGNIKSKATKPKRERKARIAKTRKSKPPKAKPKPIAKAKAKLKPKPIIVKKPAKPEKKQVATLVQPKPAKKSEPKKSEPKKPEPKTAKVKPARPKITSRPTLRPKRKIEKAELPKPVKQKLAKKPVKKPATPKNDAASKKAKKKPRDKPKKASEKQKKPKPVKKFAKKKPKKPAKKIAKKVAKKSVRKAAKKLNKRGARKTRQIATRKPKRRVRRKSRMDNIYSFLNKKKGKDRVHQTAQRRTERRGSRRNRANLPLSISERMAIARQIKPCWRFPMGAKDERTLRVEIRVWMGRDGRPIRHKILDRGRYSRDPFFRAAADAGVNAIYNPRCLPIRLPARKYDTWRIMILDFDPAKVSEGSL